MLKGILEGKMKTILIIINISLSKFHIINRESLLTFFKRSNDFNKINNTDKN